MSNRDKMNDFLTNRWSATSAPAAGTTCSADVVARGPQARIHLESLLYTIDNRGVSTGLKQTVTVNVRLGSIAGTVIASVPLTVYSSTVQNVAITNLGLPGERGIGLNVSMNTVIASMVQAVNVAGWYED
jgi:hypothetical protein